MQIVIPMSGFGERFRNKGYKIPKPLILIDDKPIIAHVIEMFPSETDFTFICNEDHLLNEDYNMQSIILTHCPTANIVSIKPHKLGPAHAVLQIIDKLFLNKPVVINYCDFCCYWNWEDFKKFVQVKKCDGAIPAYKGFHPHSLGTTNYAYIKETKKKVIDIQEKKPFTSNKMNEFASSGTYYFSTAKKLKEALKFQIKNKYKIKGEYYLSLSYKKLLKEKDLVLVYPIQHFMQWGTPEDVIEYNYWSSAFKKLCKKVNKQNQKTGTILIPMAGFGQRFVEEGYKTIKPLINVSGLPMVVKSINDLPPSKNHILVIRDDMNGVRNELMKYNNVISNLRIQSIKNKTKGQAETALLGIVDKKTELIKNLNPLTIGACDNGVIYNQKKLNDIIQKKNIDIIVWGIRGYPNSLRYPEMYGWIEDNDNIIKRVSVKKPIVGENNAIIIGTFTFKDKNQFIKIAKKLFDRSGSVNGEYYIDSCINDAIKLGLRCFLFEIDSYLCWGTPNDLRTFNYWQSCFHKWKHHPYTLDDDVKITSDVLPKIREVIEKEKQTFRVIE